MPRRLNTYENMMMDMKWRSLSGWRYRLQLVRQNKLMHICLCVLCGCKQRGRKDASRLNLAEEISIEKKMVGSSKLCVFGCLSDSEAVTKS